MMYGMSLHEKDHLGLTRWLNFKRLSRVGCEQRVKHERRTRYEPPKDIR